MKFTIEEFKNYLETQDSLGDIYYYLTEKNVIEANETDDLDTDTEDDDESEL